MGGHGGLNILPQKRWNVYNFDNREKVRKDEEAAAKEEQFNREQSRKRDFEFRLQTLRQSRGLSTPSSSSSTQSKSAPLESGSESKSDSKPADSNHINLFEGIKIFDPIGIIEEDEKKKRRDSKKMKLMKKEKEVTVVLPEDEKYRLGYGVAGKGVKLPWYAEKPSDKKGGNDGDDANGDRFSMGKEAVKSGGAGKKSLEELREERLKRERREKERERAVMLEKRGLHSRRR